MRSQQVIKRRSLVIELVHCSTETQSLFCIDQSQYTKPKQQAELH